MSRFPWTAQVQMYWCRPISSAKKPGIFNSVSGEGDKIDKIFPVMALPENKDWQVIALLSDDTGIPKCAEDRLKVFEKIMAKAKSMEFLRIVFTLILW